MLRGACVTGRSDMAGLPGLIIGNQRYSSWSLRPWLLLRQAGVAFQVERLVLDTEAFREGIHALSPSGKVPALHHNDVVVWDSLAICEYVSEVFLDGGGWPRDIAVRARARSAAAEMHSGFAALRTQLPMHVARTGTAHPWDPDAQADIDRIQTLWRALRAQAPSTGPFLCGEFGIVDAMFAPVAIRFRGYAVECRDEVADYVEALYALPAMGEWIDAGCREPERLPKYESR